jgi:DNA-binding NarL/FixJ family response regulator
MNKIKIGIVDDHQAVAQGLSAELKLSDRYEVLFTLSDKEGLPAALDKDLPDILVMDVVMPGSVGIEAFKEVLMPFPSLKIIAYTALNSPLMVELLLRAGVKGYVGKTQPLNDLLEAIAEVHYDHISLPEDYLFLHRKIQKNMDSPGELSPREIEILSLIAAEKKTSEIAALLQISVNTVETHRKNLFEKLQVSNLAGLIKAGFDLGYIK